MRLIHSVDFTIQEVEFFRRLVFVNLIQGIRAIFDAMTFFEFDIPSDIKHDFHRVLSAPDLTSTPVSRARLLASVLIESAIIHIPVRVHVKHPRLCLTLLTLSR